jgi:hypothetical protein
VPPDYQSEIKFPSKTFALKELPPLNLDFQRGGPVGAGATGVVLGGLGTSTPEGTSATRAATAGIFIVAPCWLHSLLSTVTVIVPRNAPCACCNQITCVVVCLAGASSGPRQANSIVSGRDCQAPLRKSRTTGLLPPDSLNWTWPVSSSKTPVATHHLGVHAVRKAHQVMTFGGCGSGVPS